VGRHGRQAGSGCPGRPAPWCEPAELLHAIRVVARGESLLSPTVTRRVISELASRSSQRLSAHPGIRTLTDREREVVVFAYQSGLGPPARPAV